MNKKIFCFDLDNTICTTIKKNYFSAKPKIKAIKLINKLYSRGHIIKIFTSRFMGRNHENQKKAYKQGLIKTKLQLKKWGLSYNELLMGKPSYDIYIDDKAYRYNNDWINFYKKYIN